ncbi:MAG: hypothetical protein RL536_109, partial [Candidatus Parcubacteria bacterium]
MSHDDHGHGSEQPKPTNPFFIIGTVLFIAFFALQAPRGRSTSTGTRPVPQQRITPAVVSRPVVEEQGPTYQKSILNEGMTPPPDAVVTPQVAGIAPWGYKIKFINAVSSVLKEVEGVSHQQKHTIKTANLGPEAYQIQEAGVRLTPKEIQDSSLHLITYLQNLTANHTQCFYDEENGFEHHPDVGIFKAAALRWNYARGGAKLLQSTISTGKLPLEGYDLFNTLPDEKVTAENGLACYTQDKGKPTGLFDLNTGEEEYDGANGPPATWTPDQFCPNETLKYLECMARNKGREKDDPEWENCDLVCSGDAHTVYSTNLPGAMKEKDITDNIGYLTPGDPQGYTYTQ